jgi:hypothetical protein
METEGSLSHLQVPATCPYPELSLLTLRYMVHFYGKKLLAPSPNPKLEDQPFSEIRDC